MCAASTTSNSSLKSGFLRLLREDEEFRYAVAGLLGLDTILSELKKLREDFLIFVKEQERRWEENNRRWEENNRKWEENSKRWEEAYKRFEAIENELKALREDQKRLWEESRRIWEEIHKIWQEIKLMRKDYEDLRKDVVTLKKDVDVLKRDMRSVKKSIQRIDTTINRLAISIEDEANEFISYLLKQRGIDIKTEPSVIGQREFDVYGTNGVITVVGEAKTRAGAKTARKLIERVEEARKIQPEKFPGKTIVVIYCMRATPDAIEEASKLGIWVIESGKERTQLSM
ncbi:MAG: hypothetical protein QW141_06825 [Ignisphaera sp.]